MPLPEGDVCKVYETLQDARLHRFDEITASLEKVEVSDDLRTQTNNHVLTSIKKDGIDLVEGVLFIDAVDELD